MFVGIGQLVIERVLRAVCVEAIHGVHGVQCDLAERRPECSERLLRARSHDTMARATDAKKVGKRSDDHSGELNCDTIKTRSARSAQTFNQRSCDRSKGFGKWPTIEIS